RVATEILCCVRSMVTASSAGSAASRSATERARHCPVLLSQAEGFCAAGFIANTFLSYRRAQYKTESKKQKAEIQTRCTCVATGCGELGLFAHEKKWFDLV